MNTYLVVAAGSAIGGALRHAVNVASTRAQGADVPYSTVIVNVAGSFLMGLLAARFALHGGAQSWRLFLMTGILGGFTTFSAYSLDTIQLYQRGQPGLAVAYACGTVISSLAALVAGLAIARSWG